MDHWLLQAGGRLPGPCLPCFSSHPLLLVLPSCPFPPQVGADAGRFYSVNVPLAVRPAWGRAVDGVLLTPKPAEIAAELSLCCPPPPPPRRARAPTPSSTPHPFWQDGMDDASFAGLFVPIMDAVVERYRPSAIVLQSGASCRAQGQGGGRRQCAGEVDRLWEAAVF